MTTTENGSEEAKQLTPAEKKALFVAYDEASETVDMAQQELDTAKKAHGAAAKAIVDAIGPGPWKWKDSVLTFMKKKGSDSYHARGRSKEAQEIG